MILNISKASLESMTSILSPAASVMSQLKKDAIWFFEILLSLQAAVKRLEQRAQ
jgi:hypothetical protein